MKTLSSKRRISVFSEKDKEFDENQALDRARVYIRLRVKLKDIKAEDSLDLLLSELSKKILSMGYGAKGTFDIRLEKGCLSLEGNSWKWHFDGEIFKTSISVCYSNKKNWSTRIPGWKMEDGEPAKHGFLYDALKVYHRAPVPSDLEGEELNAEDYRLFIRYNEFYTKGASICTDRDAVEKKEGKTPSLLSDYKHTDYKHIRKVTEVGHLLREQSSTIALSDWVGSKYANHLVDSKLTEGAFAKYSESLHTSFTLNVPEYNFSGLLAELRIHGVTDSNGSISTAQAQFDRYIDTPMSTKDNALPIASEMEHTQPGEENKRFECKVM